MDAGGQSPELLNIWGISSVQSLSHVQLFVIPWTAAHQASLSITNCRRLPKTMSIELVMPFNHLILSSPFPPALNLFHHQGLLKWVSSPHQVAKVGVLASISVLRMNTQDWSHLGWTGWISWQSKGLSRVFSNTTVQEYQFFSTQLSSVLDFLHSPTFTSIHNHWKNHDLD